MVDYVEIETREGLKRYPLDKQRLTIGRLPGNDITIPFVQISRHHAELRQRGQDWWIIDAGSTNGIHVNNRVVKEFLLRGNEKIILAPGINLYFVTQRLQPETVEGTVELPSVPRKELALPIPEPGSFDPFERSLDDIASSLSMPIPRRRVGITPPPPAQADRPPPRPMPVIQPERPATDEDLDEWLNDASSNKEPQSPEKKSLPSSGGKDLPISTPYGILRRNSPPPPEPRKPLLYVCPTCNERTAPDSPYCWNCHQTIAHPCRICQLYLLPIQAVCPRCHTPNPQTVRRP
jgi:hypothetical protein